MPQRSIVSAQSLVRAAVDAQGQPFCTQSHTNSTLKHKQADVLATLAISLGDLEDC